MSLNKNLKFSDYKNVIIQNDDAGKFPLLLTDLINASGAADDAKIIASIFLYAKKSNSDTNGFLILKPKCLWLSKSSGQLLDANGNSNIAEFVKYNSEDTIKASFLTERTTVAAVLTGRGVTSVPTAINGLSQIFMYDTNELNRTRSASISTTGNAALNSIWL
jgi:hypothetical protein